MKGLVLAAAAAAATLSGAVPAYAANVDVGVSVQISQPGVYGRIDIGRFPQPQVVVAQPVIVQQPVAEPPPPVYMWVPPGHRKHWRRYCAQYQACGVPVYFVRDDWYGTHVRSRGPDRYDGRRDGWRDGWRDERRDDHRDGRDERRDEHRDGRGEGRGEGRGGD